MPLNIRMSLVKMPSNRRFASMSMLAVCQIPGIRTTSITMVSNSNPNPSSLFDPTLVYEIGLQGGFLNRITINGVEHGVGIEGTDHGSITLGKDEYISEVEYFSLHYLKFTTNQGRTIGSDGNHGQKIKNIRLLTIGGEFNDKHVTKLNLTYINNYQPSERVAENQKFILAYTFDEFQEYTGHFDRMAEMYENITAHMINRNCSDTVNSEFFLKIASSMPIEAKDTRLKTLWSELKKYKATSTKTTHKIPEGHIGIQLAKGDIMKGVDGDFWMSPSSPGVYSVMDITEKSDLFGFYDLTGLLCTQMPCLESCKSYRCGYDYYDEPY